jgi:type IV secretory pathway VirB2 component (pilin)
MKKLLAAVGSTALYALPAAALAGGFTGEANFGFTNFGSATNLGTNVPVVATIANIINLILGFLGVLAVVLIVIAGFRWMTSQGNEEQIAGAKKLMAAGVVGLVIIFVAYALAYFIVTQLANATAARY